MDSKSLNKWLQLSGTIAQNIKSNLCLTLNTLHQTCPIKLVTRESISKSLKNILQSDMVFQQQNKANFTVHNWFQKQKKEQQKKKNNPRCNH